MTCRILENETLEERVKREALEREIGETVNKLDDALLIQARGVLDGALSADGVSDGVRGWLAALEAHPDLQELVFRRHEFPEEHWEGEGQNPVLHVQLHASTLAEPEEVERVLTPLKNYAARFHESDEAAMHVAIHVHNMLMLATLWGAYNDVEVAEENKALLADVTENRLTSLPSHFLAVLQNPPHSIDSTGNE